MFYDLHIHSALSPCAEDDMTVNNIVNMALIIGLNLIAVTDHNSVKQLAAFKKVAEGKIDYLLGCEMQSLEKIHVLAYFPKDHDIAPVQEYLDRHLDAGMNIPAYYGNQLILNENDETVGVEPRLLLDSLDRNVDEVIADIHELGGRAVLAHLYRKHGFIDHFGTLSFELPFDGVEVSLKDRPRLFEEYPQVKERLVLTNSDAHQLVDIQEPIHRLDTSEIEFLKGERACLT